MVGDVGAGGTRRDRAGRHAVPAVGADDAGNVYISVEYGHKVRRVDPAGIITTFAGRGAGAYSGALGDGGPATEAAFAFPTDLAVHDGNLYILDEGSRPRVRKVDKAGIITTLVGQR